MVSKAFDWNAISCEPDIIMKITSYLSYKDIDNLENSSINLKLVFEKIRLWERKIVLEFPYFVLSDEYEDNPNHIYWQLRYLDHYCNSKCYNICNICYNQTICFNITHCNSLH